ncbi:hypothetical protein AAC03nite_11310 [Alicyclobacillus acidoterrestris]|nr:hypothetical protein AAC03nite_11310 [Alicyclobacillus acidoterrestris]
MRIVSFLVNHEERIGIEIEEGFLDLNLACRGMLAARGEHESDRLANLLVPTDAVAFLRGSHRTFDHARQVVNFVLEQSASERQAYIYDPDSVQRLSPIPHPGKIVCVGRNYHDHVSEMKRDVPTIPVVFAKLSNTVCADGDGVPFPQVSDQLDYEAELGVVIGKQGRYISEEDAMDYVAGYTVLNDITVRDWQHRTPQWLQGKSFDLSGPIGPVMVTADELPDPHRLDIKLWLNDELRQHDNTGRLIFNIPFLISFISQIMTLEPGDIIATGTPGGVGVAMNPKGFMKVGDVVRVEIEGIGSLENRIVNTENVRKIATGIRELHADLERAAVKVAAPALHFKPSEDAWSVAQILAHVAEFEHFFSQDVLHVKGNPGTNFGRTVTHEARLEAVNLSGTETLVTLMEGLNRGKQEVLHMLSRLTDDDLSIEAVNPKFGTQTIAWIIGHFITEHLEKHIGQVERTHRAYQAQPQH